MDRRDRNQMMMGFAEVDITPEEPVETIGFGRQDERSRGVLGRLLAQTCVWQSGEELCCLAAIDHIGFSIEHGDYLRMEIGTVLKVPMEKVMLCFSHTHSAPNDSAEPGYFMALCRKVKEAAARAFRGMVLVSAAWGNAVAEIGLNRRPDSEYLDKRMGILKVCGTDGNLRLILLRLTAHCNVLKADNYLISPDYFGAVRDLLQEQYGCPVMVTQGASGNVAPRFFKSKLNPPDACDSRFIRTETALEDMARNVSDALCPALESIRPVEGGYLSMYSERIALTSQVPPLEEAMRVGDEAKEICGMDQGPWISEVKRLLAAGISEQICETEVQYFALGNGCLCGVANEIMCEFALEASRRLGDEFFYFGGYTNGCSGYFPTEEEFDKGGYEVYWSMLVYFPYYGRVYPFKRDSASRLIRFAVEHDHKR